MNTIDRKFQIKLLKEIGKVKPHSALMFPTSTTPLVVNLVYLAGHHLIKCDATADDKGRISIIRATEITIAGLDFLAGKYRTPSEDVSGLSSICDSIKKIVIKKIQSEEHDPTEKKNLIERIKNLSADETIKIFLKAVEDGLVSFPDTPQGFQNGVHSPDNPIAIS